MSEHHEHFVKPCPRCYGALKNWWEMMQRFDVCQSCSGKASGARWTLATGYSGPFECRISPWDWNECSDCGAEIDGETANYIFVFPHCLRCYLVRHAQECGCDAFPHVQLPHRVEWRHGAV